MVASLIINHTVLCSLVSEKQVAIIIISLHAINHAKDLTKVDRPPGSITSPSNHISLASPAQLFFFFVLLWSPPPPKPLRPDQKLA